MKPGLTASPAASISRLPVPALPPTPSADAVVATHVAGRPGARYRRRSSPADHQIVCHAVLRHEVAGSRSSRQVSAHSKDAHGNGRTRERCLPFPMPGQAQVLGGTGSGTRVHDVAALLDPLLARGPVDAEVDPALTVLVLGLREAGEAARLQLSRTLPLIVDGDAVELVRSECRERDVVGAEDAARLSGAPPKRRAEIRQNGGGKCPERWR